MSPSSASRGPASGAFLFACALLVGGCSVRPGTGDDARTEPSSGDLAVPVQGQAAALPGIAHFRRWSDRLGQGSQPEGEEAFAALAAQGFRTILSVDGAVPAIDAAARHGLQYVHVPIGYDGIAFVQQQQIIKAVSASAGPVYVHCHHGLHRGPAATAIARMAIDGVSHDDAYQGLKQSGCSPNYAGLYRDVAAFVFPSAAVIDALPAPPSQVRPSGIRASMVAVDELWGSLKSCKSAGWHAPSDHPDVQPSHEALMLQEQLRELARLDATQHMGEEFLALLADSERLAGELSAILAADVGVQAADVAYVSLKQSCSSCHVDYRD